MRSLFDQPFYAAVGADRSRPPLSQLEESVVVRVSSLIYDLVQTAPRALLVQAAASGSHSALIGAIADMIATRPANSDSWAVLHAKGRVALAARLEASGGAWTADQAVSELGVGRSTLQAWRDKQRVMALPRSDGSFAYPIAQFEPPTADTGRPRPYATIGEVQRLVGDRMSAEELICVMATPQEMLARRGIMRTPFAAIAHGDGSLVLALLDHLITSSDEGAPSSLSVG